MKKAVDVLKYWGQLLLLPLYWLSFLFPRDKKLWLFGSTFGRRFADNPRYLYIYASGHRDELGIRPVWITHEAKIVDFLNENGYEAYRYHSLMGIWLALRGGVYIFDNYSKDINFWQSGGAAKINLWHGIPLKKIQADNSFDKFRNPKGFWERINAFPRRISDEKPGHYVLAASEKLCGIFSSAFRTKNVLVAGYPRNDALTMSDGGARNPMYELLTDSERDALEKIKDFKKRHDGKAIFYMPTFRKSETKFFEVFDIQRFAAFLEKEHILFCIKLHPKSKLREKFECVRGKNIIVVDADDDPYPLLREADALVTDYSSIYFDWLLTDRPIIFFAYDLEEYLTLSREMYFDYDDFTPGEKAKTMDELIAAIKNVVDAMKNGKEDGYGQERKRIRDKVHGRHACKNESRTSSEEAARLIKAALEAKKGRFYLRNMHHF